jgi:pimeloyl-ACP methyl ester carboxylesterase
MPLDLRRPAGPVAIPTLYVWGARDPYLTRHAALATAAQVTGPYSFEILQSSDHWLPETEGPRVAGLLLEHLDHNVP